MRLINRIEKHTLHYADKGNSIVISDNEAYKQNGET